jgi:hypothetical protein
MDFTAHVLNGVIHNLMLKIRHPLIGLQGIGEQGRTSQRVLSNVLLDLTLAPRGDNGYANFTAALKDRTIS